MNEVKFKLFDVLMCLADAVDMISPEMKSHHQMVAYLSYRLAEHMEMTVKERQNILMQGLLHDIGALSLDERLNLLEEDAKTANIHAFRGAKLLSKCTPLAHLAEGVRYHHIPWDYGRGREYEGNPVSISSHLLHLADRVSVLLDGSDNILTKVSDVIDTKRLMENAVFPPQLIQVLAELAKKEYIWLELSDAMPLRFLPESIKASLAINLEETLEVSKLFSHVIDFRSHFTATHSAGVAKTAEKLAELAGMSGNERKMILIAGYLHDIGKLTVQDSILEKPDKLNGKEFSIIRGHTYYTYRLLNQIDGFDTINQWASFHHERLNGEGYPFHLKGDQIPLGSRIMSVADVFNAITEHRPYRKGMEKQEIIHVFKSITDKGILCKNVVDILLGHLDTFILLSNATQQQAAEEYEYFFSREENLLDNAI